MSDETSGAVGDSDSLGAIFDHHGSTFDTVASANPPEQDEDEDVATGEEDDAPPAAAKSAEPDPDEESDAEDIDDDELESKPKNWRLAAIKDERAKRRELANQLEQMRVRNAQLEQYYANQMAAAQAAQAKAVDPKDVESEFYAKPTEYIERVLAQRLKAIDEKTQAELRSQKLAMADEFGRSRHEDYDDVITFFTDAAKSDRTLWDKAMVSPNPGEYAYKYGKTRKVAQDNDGDIDKFVAKIRAEHLEELRQSGELETALATPKTTAGKRSVRDRQAPVVERDSIESLFPRIR